ncbi:MAG: hypothetical protein IKQ20_07675 [Bacteroidales bacterium]|nr:hypothetical protein [Bacteroidales bacterium]
MNIKNIKNLFNAYFIENWKTDLFQFGILAAIVLFGTLTSNSGGSDSNVPVVVSSIVLMIYPERLFRNLHSASSKIHYLSIPASTGEKVLVNMLLANIYMVALAVLACGVGYGLAYLYWIMRGFEGAAFLGPHIYPSGVLFIYTMLSVFFFGSIYFRKRTTLSTFGVSLLIGLIFSILFSLILWVNGMMLVPKGAAFHDYVWSLDYSVDISEKVEETLLYVLMGVMIVYFYALSFLRLRETEA